MNRQKVRRPVGLSTLSARSVPNDPAGIVLAFGACDIHPLSNTTTVIRTARECLDALGYVHPGMLPLSDEELKDAKLVAAARAACAPESLEDVQKRPRPAPVFVTRREYSK